MTTRMLPLGIILAGGGSTRMGGGDKGVLRLGDRTILDRIASVLAPQCVEVVLNANGDLARFGTALAVVADAPGGGGPLAGVLAGLDWAAAHRADLNDVLSVTCDAPFIPADLAARLLAARDEAGRPIACAASGGRLHPAHALWPVSLRAELRAALARGERRVGAWAASRGSTSAEWPLDPVDPFLNVNTPEDLAFARGLLSAVQVDLDLRGLKCPLPALKARRALDALPAGHLLVVTCTDPMSAIDIPHMAREAGAVIEGHGVENGVLTFRLRRS